MKRVAVCSGASGLSRDQFNRNRQVQMNRRGPEAPIISRSDYFERIGFTQERQTLCDHAFRVESMFFPNGYRCQVGGPNRCWLSITDFKLL